MTNTNMRLALISLSAAAVVGCVACYFVGHRSARIVTRPVPGEREGLIMYTLEMHRALESRDFVRLRQLMDIEIATLTHTYEIQFGVPSGTDKFATEFREAKAIADRVNKELVPASSLGEAVHSADWNPQANEARSRER